MLGQLADPNILGALQAALMQQEAPQSPAGGWYTPPEHKGLFGMKGTVRDVFGVLGDALMMANGMNPMYMQQRQNEAVSDAAGLMPYDPSRAVANISRIDPKLGAAYQKQYTDSVAAERKAAADKAKDDRSYGLDREKFDWERIEKFAPGFYGTLGGADEKTWPVIRERAITASKTLGLPLPIELPEKFDPSVAAGYRNLAISPVDRANIMSREKIAATNASISQQRADTYGQSVSKRRPVDSYTNEDGYNVIQYDDGTEQVSATKTQPKQSASGTRPAPTTDTKYADTKTYQGKKYGLLPGKPRNQQSSWVVIQ